MSVGKGAWGPEYSALPRVSLTEYLRRLMPKAIWNGAVIAESEDTVVVEGNHYFPPDAVARERVRPCDDTSFCPWKGTARYYDVVVDGEVNPGAAWFYPEPKSAAAEIRDHVAFWRGVEVSD